MSKNYVTVEELAQRWRLSDDTVRRFLRRRKRPLPCYRAGRRILIDPEEAEAWLRYSRGSSELKR